MIHKKQDNNYTNSISSRRRAINIFSSKDISMLRRGELIKKEHKLKISPSNVRQDVF